LHHRTDCRKTVDGAHDCESRQRSIFLGVANGEDLIYTTSGTSIPASSGVLARNGEPCPVTNADLPTLPIRSYRACIDVAADMELGDVVVVYTKELPKHTCFLDDAYEHLVADGGEFAGQTRAEPIWNAGVDGVEWFEQVNDMQRLSEANRSRYSVICATPNVQYRKDAPPSPPVTGPGSRTQIVENCTKIRDPCDCCTSEEVQSNVCMPPAHGHLHNLNGKEYTCASRSVLNVSNLNNAVVDDAAAVICERIRPFCSPHKKSVIFSPLAGSYYDTKCSAPFYLDIANRFQGIAVGTGAGSSNSLVYLSRPDVVIRPLDGDDSEDAVAVATARIGGSLQLICFANSNARVRQLLTPSDCVCRRLSACLVPALCHRTDATASRSTLNSSRSSRTSARSPRAPPMGDASRMTRLSRRLRRHHHRLPSAS
jgi:hypothetical protein